MLQTYYKGGWLCQSLLGLNRIVPLETYQPSPCLFFSLLHSLCSSLRISKWLVSCSLYSVSLGESKRSMNKLPDSFIEERAVDFEVVKDLHKKARFIDYLNFCWEQYTRQVKKELYGGCTLETEE